MSSVVVSSCTTDNVAVEEPACGYLVMDGLINESWRTEWGWTDAANDAREGSGEVDDRIFAATNRSTCKGTFGLAAPGQTQGTILMDTACEAAMRLGIVAMEVELARVPQLCGHSPNSRGRRAERARR